MVKTLVLKPAARYMRNSNGYAQSRAGDETSPWFVQRRRGQKSRVWRTIEVVDSRRNTVVVAGPEGPIGVVFVP